jgi:soluble lytic murein transglycosylase
MKIPTHSFWHSAGLVLAASVAAIGAVGAQDQVVGRLAITQHPPLPGHPSLFWLVPDTSVAPTAARAATETATVRLARGADLIARGDFAAALPLVRGSVLPAPLVNYGQYYTAVALAGLGRPIDADALLADLDDRDPEGYLEEVIPARRAEAALARGDFDKAISLLEDLSDEKVLVPEDVLLQLARALERAGKREKALQIYRRIYYEFPLSDQAADAQAGIERLETPSLIAPNRFTLELERAERLFTARRYAQARAGFAPLIRATTGNNRERVALRLAECDYYLNRHRAARDALVPYLDDTSREAEARFFHLAATRGVGDRDRYVALARNLIVDFPDSPWAEETLNNLASYYVTLDDDATADRVFRELSERFPKGRYAERAAWKIGWWAYKTGDVREAVEIFETAAAAFPRADYRPAWLYWAGRARDRAGEPELANARYRLAATDYLNSYYGRLASTILAGRQQPPAARSVRSDASAALLNVRVPNDATIRQLIAVELFDDAVREVQYAQRVWGDSPALQATLAWIRHEEGLDMRASERFERLRGAITTMRRAYPQFLAAGGEDLPPDVLHIIFPLDYWPLIKKYSDARGLDPYLMAALIAQESTFTPEIRSAANAVGLMQLLPSTARRYARKVGIRFSTASLTQAESNIRMGMAYFKDLMDRFGSPHLALASYNAGEQRVARWLAERPGFAQDEFIDDIPFPETQNYVKRILGTAEDYRRLYGGGVLLPDNSLNAPKRRAAPRVSAVRATAATR